MSFTGLHRSLKQDDVTFAREWPIQTQVAIMEKW